MIVALYPPSGPLRGKLREIVDARSLLNCMGAHDAGAIVPPNEDTISPAEKCFGHGAGRITTVL